MIRVGIIVLAILALTSIVFTQPLYLVNDPGDGRDFNLTDGVCSTVGATCTLRAAIEQANADGQAVDIQFDLTTPVDPASPLPEINVPISLDGGGTCASPAITIDGGGLITDGLVVNADGGSIRGVAIVGFTGRGVWLNTGGSTIVECNNIQNNALGIDVWSGGNTVQNNQIATNTNGISVLGPAGNQILDNTITGNLADGIQIIDGAGATTISGNRVSGNGEVGVQVAFADGHDIHDNVIGLDATGTVLEPNGLDGVQLLDASSNNVTGNQIGGSVRYGVYVLAVDGATANQITSNTLRSNSNGAITLRGAVDTLVMGNTIEQNSGTGISLTDCATTQAVDNQVVNNGGWGVAVAGGQANQIGIDSFGNTVTGNLGGVLLDNLTENNAVTDNDIASNNIGVLLTNGARANTIANNRIVNNAADGIRGETGIQDNIFRINRITANGGLGIDLDADGVSDPGPQALPVITSAVGSTISGTVDTTPGAEIEIAFFANTACDPSGYGEGETFIGLTRLTASSGPTPFAAVLSDPVPVGRYLTATATGATTSEFSRCFFVPVPNTPPLVNDDAFTLVEGGTIQGNLLLNDSDPDGDPLAVTGNTAPGQGTVTVAADGNFTYQHTGLTPGTDSFSYTACDGRGGCNSAQVTLTITDIGSGLTVQKSANPTQLVVPGGAVTYTVIITNTGGRDAITLTALNDSRVVGACQTLVNRTLAPGASESCTYVAAVTGDSAAIVDNVMTVSANDDDGNFIQASGAASVTLLMPSPTEEPTTPSPTEEPTTPSPTEEPTTPSPTEEPTTPSPTEEPTTPSPTEEPTTPSPTEEPTTPSPTEEPTTPSPTEEPTTPSPTEEPTTPSPTEEPTTPSPTEEPTTPSPTEEPTTQSPTEEPTTPSPTEEPTTPSPTEEPPVEPGLVCPLGTMLVLVDPYEGIRMDQDPTQIVRSLTLDAPASGGGFVIVSGVGHPERGCPNSDDSSCDQDQPNESFNIVVDGVALSNPVTGNLPTIPDHGNHQWHSFFAPYDIEAGTHEIVFRHSMEPGSAGSVFVKAAYCVP